MRSQNLALQLPQGCISNRQLPLTGAPREHIGKPFNAIGLISLTFDCKARLAFA